MNKPVKGPAPKLEEQVEKQAQRMKQADRDRPTLLGYSVYLGTLGLVFILPLIAGAYLGQWLDKQLSGYSTSWTVSLIIVGIVIGAINVYLLVRENDHE